MSAGYVYFLTNSSMPNLIKIGRTYRKPEIRAKELYTTGVPSPFEVAYEIFSENHEFLEKILHEKLNKCRHTSNREFFQISVENAAFIAQCLASEINANIVESYQSVSIMYELRFMYQDWIKDEYKDIRITQSQTRVWLETITEEILNNGNLIDQAIKRTDLSFIEDEDDMMFFSPSHTVQENAFKFTHKLDTYSILMVTDIFNQKASEIILKDK